MSANDNIIYLSLGYIRSAVEVLDTCGFSEKPALKMLKNKMQEYSNTTDNVSIPFTAEEAELLLEPRMTTAMLQAGAYIITRGAENLERVGMKYIKQEQALVPKAA